MTPTTSTAESLDHLDPWGFHRSAADDRSVIIEHLEPLDEPVDQDEPLFGLFPELATAAPHVPTPMVATSLAAARARGWRLPLQNQMVGVLAVFAAVIFAQAFYIGFSLTGEASARPDVGEALVSSHPTGAQVRVDGRLQGTTPLVMPLSAGRHLLEVAGPVGDPVQVEAQVVAGQRWSRHIVLRGAPASSVGALRIDTGRTPAQVLIDGALAGSTPFSRDDLAAGDHAVRVEFRSGPSIERTVTVPAHETVSLVFAAPAPARATVPAVPVSGWVRVDAPFEVEVFAAGQRVGSSASERIMLTPGGHVLELVNSALGYRQLVKAAVVPGKLVPLVIEVPRVPVAVNAQPWAEVVVDGHPRGDTPLANLLLPIGVHQIVLRHPELGERTETVTVRATGTTRVSADLRR